MHFRDLNEPQILALAITAEEEDARIYRDFAESLRADFSSTAELFTKMAREEDEHRQRLIELYRQRFGEHIPLIRRQDVKGFFLRRPSWFTQTLRPEHARDEAALMEIESRRFYEAAAQRTNDAGVRQLLGDLAEAEQQHEAAAEEITEAQITAGALSRERDVARRLFVLRFVQPGLTGLMDGSVSSLAPLFAAAFATGDTLATFKVGLAASVGAGIRHLCSRYEMGRQPRAAARFLEKYKDRVLYGSDSTPATRMYRGVVAAAGKCRRVHPRSGLVEAVRFEPSRRSTRRHLRRQREANSQLELAEAMRVARGRLLDFRRQMLLRLSNPPPPRFRPPDQQPSG